MISERRILSATFIAKITRTITLHDRLSLPGSNPLLYNVSLLNGSVINVLTITHRTTYEDLRRDARVEACEFLPVRKNAIGFVIGKKGNTIKQIEEKSGAKISTKSDSGRTGFMIHGNEKQRACARGLINETVVSGS